MEMTPEQIAEMQVAIHKQLGNSVPEFSCDTENECYIDCLESYNEQIALIPNYPADLNAMHEAEKVLMKGYEDDPDRCELWSDYTTHLMLAAPAYLSCHATALQRAEAFCRVFKIGPFKH